MYENGKEQEDQFSLLAAPLQEQAGMLRAKLENIDEERKLVAGQLHRLDSAIARLLDEHPKLGRPKGKTPKPKAFRRGDKRDAMQQFMQTHAAELADGFSTADLLARLQAANVEIGKDRVRIVLDEMHEQGALRLDRVGRGGQKFYKLIGEEVGAGVEDG